MTVPACTSTTHLDLSADHASVLYGPRDVRAEQIARDTVGNGQVRISVSSVGLCGSDVHYFTDGRNGGKTVSTPTVLGHEGFGTIIEVGTGVPESRLGQRVAVEPATPCLNCQTCFAGRYNICPHGTCLGSPPTHGLLRSTAVIPSMFAHPLPPQIRNREATLIEPLAVACWAVERAGSLTGKTVLVTGAGPIGLLVVQAAHAAGAAEVLVTDVSPSRLAAARALGATTLSADSSEVSTVGADAALECSGSESAIRTATRALRPGGVLVLVGVCGAVDPGFPVEYVQSCELDVRGCFRYGPGAFTTAIAWAADKRVDLSPLVTSRFSLDHATDALETASSDRSQLKVVIDVSPLEEYA
ncbi:zinc-binding dehydrogenase [Rhodococcoides yunnanense]|uniref:zinc-binding dehydrogenase n=1 Tax=Rhodococcoides yunnanense TaxID=278209 RepID=UPI001FE7E70C|nr:alcohol dehydrogenase catalytic domain-containing protein [Rhodococcus yunnanensis]